MLSHCYLAYRLRPTTIEALVRVRTGDRVRHDEIARNTDELPVCADTLHASLMAPVRVHTRGVTPRQSDLHACPHIHVRSIMTCVVRVEVISRIVSDSLHVQRYPLFVILGDARPVMLSPCNTFTCPAHSAWAASCQHARYSSCLFFMYKLTGLDGRHFMLLQTKPQICVNHRGTLPAWAVCE